MRHLYEPKLATPGQQEEEHESFATRLLVLARVSRIPGTLAFWWPAFYATLLATLWDGDGTTALPLGALAAANGKLLLRAFLMHSWGAVVNEILDRDIDARVPRTSGRLIPSGRLSLAAAAGLAVALGGATAAFLVAALSWAGLFRDMGIIAVGHLYPLAKRVTDYPQAVLGVCTAWGVLTVEAVAEEPLGLLGAAAAAAGPWRRVSFLLLFLSCACWPLLYDSMYAIQDAEDDAKAGVRSPMIRHADSRRAFFQVVAALQVGLLAGVGFVVGASAAFWVGFATAAAVVGWMVQTVRLEDHENCEWWFAFGNPYLIGPTLALPFVLEMARQV